MYTRVEKFFFQNNPGLDLERLPVCTTIPHIPHVCVMTQHTHNDTLTIMPYIYTNIFVYANKYIYICICILSLTCPTYIFFLYIYI